VSAPSNCGNSLLAKYQFNDYIKAVPPRERETAVSIVSGLVHIPANREFEVHQDAVTDWFVGHAWTVVVLGNVLFWGMMSILIYYLG
jgi:hypothetical protein